jgi:hypothetical protein
VDDFRDRYLAALNTADVHGALSLFTNDAIVASPLYGHVPVAGYFQRLLTDSRKARAICQRSFVSRDGALALHLTCHWTFATGKEVQFDRVDILDLFVDARAGRLTLIYDTAPFRSEFAWAQSAQRTSGPI